MHYDIHEDAAVVERNYTANKHGFVDVAFALSVVMIATAVLTVILA